MARATPDGYTLLLGSTNEMVVARMINSAVKYDGAKDFTALGVIATQPMMLAASKNSGVRTAAEYLQKLRAAGYRVEALAPVKRMAEGVIEFGE